MARTGRVLILNDDAEQAESVARMARAAGHVVGLAGNSAEALRLVESQAFDVALLHHLAPGGMNGIELGHRLKEARPHISLALMVPTGSEILAIMAMRAGFDDCLVQPFGAGELLATLASGIEASARRLAQEQELSELRLAARGEPGAAQADAQTADMVRGAAMLAGALVRDVRGMVGECNRAVAAVLRATDAEAQGRAALEFLVRHTRALDLLARQMEALGQSRGRRQTAVNLNQLLHELAEAVGPVAGRTRLVLRLPTTTVRVAADRERLLQILVCLVTSALDAVGETPDPQITLEVKDQGDTGSLSVRDNGPPIRQCEIEKLFEPFQAASRQKNDAGLRLFCAKQIAQELGATLTFDARDGVAFILQLSKASRGA